MEDGRFIGKIINRNDVDYEKRKLQLLKLRYVEMICDYDHSKKGEGIDLDEYDNVCDYAVVIDKEIDEVIGTYRFIKKEHINDISNKSFLLENEYNIDSIKDMNILEVGRAVIDKRYRNGSVILMLWKQALAYALEQNIDLLIGTASFHGIDIKPYLNCFRYIQKYYTSEYDCYAINNVFDLYQNFEEEIDEKDAKKFMPPLVKGYIALGGKYGKNVYIDKEFNSLDMLVITEIKKMNKKYIERLIK